MPEYSIYNRNSNITSTPSSSFYSQEIDSLVTGTVDRELAQQMNSMSEDVSFAFSLYQPSIIIFDACVQSGEQGQVTPLGRITLAQALLVLTDLHQSRARRSLFTRLLGTFPIHDSRTTHLYPQATPACRDAPERARVKRGWTGQ